MLVTCLWYGLCSSSVPDRGIAFPTLVGFAFGLRVVPFPSGSRCGLWLGLVRKAVRPSLGSVLLLHLGSSSLPWLWGFLPPCSFSCLPLGMWSPFRVISVLCYYCSPTKVSFGGVFLLGGSLPFRSGVVVSLRSLSVCRGSW